MEPNVHTPDRWDAASRGYAERVAPVLMEPFVPELVERLECDPEHEAVEVAAGSGALTATLYEHVKSLLVTDFSPKMLDLVRERLKARGAGNVRFEVMDGQDLALDDASFDRAACCFALMLFPDRARGFSELSRVLRPGGRVMVSGWAGPDRFEMFALFVGAVRRAFPDLPPPPSPPAVFSLADPAAFAAEMREAGFTGVDVDVISRDLEIAGFDDLWSMLSIGAPPVEALFEQLGPDGKPRVRDALAAIVEERFGAGAIRVSNAATVGCGVTT